jgi:hypothetical protein
VAQLDAALHVLPPQVDVAVAQARVLADGRVLVDRERRRLRIREQLEVAYIELDLAGGHVRVDVLLLARDDRAEGADDVLGAQLLGLCVGVVLGMEDELDQAAAIAQVDEDQPAVVAPAVHPPGHAQLLSDVLLAHVAGPDGAVAVRTRQLSHSDGSSSASIAATAASSPWTSCSEPPARTRIDSGPTTATASAPTRPACFN